MADNDDQVPEIGQEAAEQKDDTLHITPKVSPETSKFKREKLSLKRLEGGAEVPSANLAETAADAPAAQVPPATEERVADPAARRDTNTANLRRIRPATEVATPGDVPASPGKETDTETIHLKVIKEKKNVSQLKNLLSASQTIRLRPTQAPATAAAQAAAGVEIPSPPTAPVSANLGAPQPSPAPTAAPGGDDSQKRTLKIKAPSFESSPTSQPPGAATQAATVVPTETAQVLGGANPRSTLKIKAPPGTAPGVASLNTPTNTVSGAEQQKKKSTLKIKAPTVAPPTGAGAPVARQGAPVVPAAPPSAETLRQDPSLPAAPLPVKQATPTQQLVREKSSVAAAAAGAAAGAAARPAATVAATPAPGAAPSQQTVRQEAPAASPTAGPGSAKTLKLRSPKPGESNVPTAPGAAVTAAASPVGAAVTEAQGRPAVAAAPANAAPTVAPAPASTIASKRAAVQARSAADAGVLYTLGAAASVLLLLGTLFFAVRSYLDLSA